jgi:predicted PurR-regulated permease PerM
MSTESTEETPVGKADAAAVEAEHAARRKREGRHVHIVLESFGIPVGRVALGTAVVLAVLFLAFVTYKVLNILLLLFIALLIATAIEPLVNLLRRGPFSRSQGILIVYSGLFIIIGLIVYMLVTVFISQIGDLGGSLQKTIQSMQQDVKTMDNGIMRQELTSVLNAANSFVKPLVVPQSANDSANVDVVTTTALTVAEIFFAVVTVFVVAYYWLSERAFIKRSVVSWLSVKRAERVRRVWDDIEVKVGGWVRGQLTLMLIVGVVSAVGYFVIGVKYWPALAVFIGLAELIPLVGPYIGTAPAVLVALTQQGNDGLPALLGMNDFGNVTRALLVVVFAVILQSVEGNVLVPRVMKNSVGISALTVIVSLLIGSALAGLAGALIAVPIAGIVQVIMSDFKAARESDQALAEATEASTETRLESGELVVPYESAGQTRAVVQPKT